MGKKDKLLALIISLFLTFSCSTNNKNFLEGEWVEYIDEFERFERFFPIRGFHLMNNDSLEFFTGFWERKPDDQLRYLTNYGLYYLKKDSLFFVSPNDTLKFTVNFASPDSMLLRGEGWDSVKPYVKVKPRNTNYYILDSIILTSGHGWGESQIYKVFVQNETYEWERWGLKESQKLSSKGKLTATEVRNIVDKYNNADFMSADTHISNVDGFEVSILFFKGGELIKKIRFSNYDAPPRLIWAFLYQSNLIDKLNDCSPMRL